MPSLERVRPHQDRPPVALLVGVACILILVGLVACGSDDQPKPAATAPDQRAFPTIITDEDLEAVPADGPERTVLGWFQAIQFKDVNAAARFVDPAVLRRTGRDVFRAAVVTVGAALGRPTFVATRRRGDQVALRVLIVGYGSDRKPAGSEALTLYLRRIAGQWRVADLTYLVRSSDAIAEASRRRRP